MFLLDDGECYKSLNQTPVRTMPSSSIRAGVFLFPGIAVQPGGYVARVNIDDNIESQNEFWKLIDIVGDRDACLGKLVRFFRLCQNRYGRELAVTEQELDDEGLYCMIQSGWAVQYHDGYQAKGADKHFAWYLQKVSAGCKGGRPPKNRDKPDGNREKPDGLRKEPSENPPAPALVTAPDNGTTVLPSNSKENNKSKVSRERPPKKKARQIREDFQPSDDDRKAVAEEAAVVDLDAETRKMVSYYLANGKPMKRWGQAWRNWIRKAAEYATERKANGSREQKSFKEKENDAWMADQARLRGYDV